MLLSLAGCGQSASGAPNPWSEAGVSNPAAPDSGGPDSGASNAVDGGHDQAADSGSPAPDAGAADSWTPAAPDAAPPDNADPPPDGAVEAVWGVHDGEKVERDDLNNPAKASNSAWDGHTIKLFGGRNEVVAFQLVVQAGGAGIQALSASLPQLSNAAAGASIQYAPPAADPTDYVGRPIQVLTENYMNVTDPTNAPWITEPGKASSPPDMLGWKPVQLVPENATQGRGGLPIAVAPDTNQALWFDIYLGKSLPAGVYDGIVRLTIDGGEIDVPVQLELFDFTLPDDNDLSYMLYYEPEQVQLYQGANYDDRYHRLAHRFRVEFVEAYDVASAQQHLGRFTGTDFTASHGYEGPGASVGNTVIPRTMWGPGNEFDTDQSARAASDEWMEFLDDQLPGKVTLLYMPDEPSSSDYPGIIAIAGRIHANPGPGGELPVFVTHGYTSALDSAIDRWCSQAGGYDQSRAQTERSHGDDMWYYNGQRPYIGSLLIDSPATDPRVHGWACFKDDISVYFYWHVNQWEHNKSAPSGYGREQNVWLNPMTFINKSSEHGNGDGVLVYPGQELLHPDQDRGIAGPIASIQLANLRRGAQDNAYLALARQYGLDTEVQQALGSVVPKVFSDASSSVSFPEHGDAYENARHALAVALASH